MKRMIILALWMVFFLVACTPFLSTRPGQEKALQRPIDAGLKSINSLDVYTENSAIHAVFSGIDKKTQLPVLRYLSSLDSGKTWSLPVTVNQGISSVKKSRRGNDFQLASDGENVMAVWQTEGGEPWTGKLSAALSKDSGKTWHKIPSPVSDKYAKIDQGYFDLAADSQGIFHIVWLDDREELGDTQGLRYAAFRDDKNGYAWVNHKDLELTACTCCWTRIIADEDGNLHVLYRNDNPRDMMLISSFDGGKSWQKPGEVWPFGWEFVGCPHQGGGIATSQIDGKAILHSVIWNGKENNRGLYYSHKDSAEAQWAPTLSIGDNASTSADIAALDNEHIGIVYTTSDIESKNVIAKISKDGGKTWSNEYRLTAEGAAPSHPRIIDTAEGFRFFWTEWQENGDAIGMMAELQ